MKVELAEGTEQQTFNYIAVPDPNNKLSPRYLREDLTWNLPQDEYVKFIRYVSDFNDKGYLARLIANRINFLNGLSDELLLSGFFDSLLNVALPLVNSIFPGSGTIAGSLIGIVGNLTGTGSTTDQPPVTTDPTKAQSDPTGIAATFWTTNEDGSYSIKTVYNDGSTSTTTYPAPVQIPETDKQIIQSIIAISNGSDSDSVKMDRITQLLEKGIVDYQKKISWIAMAVSNGDIDMKYLNPYIQGLVNDYMSKNGLTVKTGSTVLNNILGIKPGQNSASIGGVLTGNIFGIPNLIAIPAAIYGASKLIK